MGPTKARSNRILWNRKSSIEANVEKDGDSVDSKGSCNSKGENCDEYVELSREKAPRGT